MQQPETTSELLLLPDGQILVHNLTPEFAALLSVLNLDDTRMSQRASPLPPAAADHTLRLRALRLRALRLRALRLRALRLRSGQAGQADHTDFPHDQASIGH